MPVEWSTDSLPIYIFPPTFKLMLYNENKYSSIASTLLDKVHEDGYSSATFI